MLAEDWEQIKLVFESARGLPPSQRSAYIESACTGDPQQQAIVTELLNNDAVAGRFLETDTIRCKRAFLKDDIVAARFRIVRFIGEGGVGEVYEAFDEKLKIRVALKTLRSELVRDQQALERFRREILVAREVPHESVCQVFDLVEHTGSGDGPPVPCLTMKLIEGESLLKYLQTHRPVPVEEALVIIRLVAGAIDALHAHGIIHRDLKPSNIMLTHRNGEVRALVTDFGLAKPATASEDGIFESQRNFNAGTPYFMAPELLRDGRPGKASDIYALGMIIDEMVTTTRAFPAESLHALYYQKLWEEPIAPGSRANGLPANWDRVIRRCLSANPASRYACAGDVVSELEQAAPSTADEITEPVVPEIGGPVMIQRPVVSGGWHLHWRLPFSRRTLLIAGLIAMSLTGAVLASMSLRTPLRTSVVVFPIENLTNNPEVNYLCQGIGAEVMRRLTLVDGVQVVPYYEPRNKVRPDELKGRFSLQGLLQVSGKQVRLTAQLIENHDGTLLWSQNFDRDIENPLQLQSDIAEGSVEALQLHAVFGRPLGANTGMLLPGPLLDLLGQKVVVPQAATTSPAAFNYYVRGRYLFEERTVPAALSAMENFQSALRADPHFALAKAAMAETQFVLVDYEYEPTQVLLERARNYAEEAVRLNPNVAEAYTALAAVQQTDWQFAEAERSYRQAIRINPRFSRAHRWYAGFLLQFARYQECLDEMRRAVDLDPYDYPAQANLGLFLLFSRHYQEAAALLERTLDHKELIIAHADLGDVYFQLGLESTGDTAKAYFARALHQADLVEQALRRTMSQSTGGSGAISIRYGDRMHAAYYTKMGHAELARPYLERLIADTTAGRISPFSLAMVYAAAGHAEKAVPLLEKAAQHRDHQLLFLRVIPQFDPIRGDPGFRSLLSRIGIA